MSNTILYTEGLTSWSEFLDLTGTFQWMLVLSSASYVPDCDADQFVADIAADEPTDGSYARVAIGGMSVTDDFLNCNTVMDCNNPSFTTFAGGEAVQWLVLFKFVTNDADSPLMAAFQIAWTADGSNFVPIVNPSGLVLMRQGA